MNFEDALRQYEGEHGQVINRDQLEWFYTKGKLDLMAEEMGKRGII